MVANIRDGERSVGSVGGIADVANRLVRQLVNNGASHGEPTHTAVDDADCRVRIHRFSLATSVKHGGDRGITG